MKILYKNKMATSLALISILTFHPTISFAKEDAISNFFTKMFSSNSSTTDQSTKNQIFKSDISSLNIQNLEDFKTSIQSILKNYLDEKKINSFLENISDEKDKNLNANSLDQFENLLPKSSTDKIKGQVLIRLAKKLGKDEKTIFQIKKYIILQVAISQDVTLAFNNKVKKTEIAKVEKEDDIDIKKASSSNMPVIAAIAGLGALGGGGGGGGSGSSSSSTFLDETTTYTYSASLDTTWKARQEYINVGQYTDTGDNTQTSAINPYTLVGINNAYARGLSGTGKTIAIMDNKYLASGTTHLEFSTKNNAGKISTYGTLTTGGTYHGAHVMGLAAGDYNDNSSSFNSYYSGGNFDKLKYGMMGVAYNAGLHLSDFTQTESGSAQKHFASATDSANSANAIVQNNSWGFANAAYTINYFKNLQDNNGYSDLGTYASVTDSESNWNSYVTALNNFQTKGVIVRSSGNNYSADSVGAYAGMPIIFSELAEAWLAVGNVDVTGSTLSASTVSRKGNPCGIAAEFCINADGHQVTSAIGAQNNRYAVYTGTSMAAPIVSGAIALLSEAFPNHTPEQLVDRLLASANNDFFTATGTTTFTNGITHGYNSEYGHGMLDLATALSPIVSSSLIPPTNGGGILNDRYGNIETARRFDLSSSQIKLGSAFGDALSNSLNGKTAYFYDGLNGGFSFNLGSLIQGSSSNQTATHSFVNKVKNSTIISRKTEDGINFITDIDNNSNLEANLLTFIPISNTHSSFLGNNINIQNAMSFSQRDEDKTFGVNSNNPFSIPFMFASEKGSSFGNLSKLERGSISYGIFNGKSKNNDIATDGFFAEYNNDFKSSNVSLFLENFNKWCILGRVNG